MLSRIQTNQLLTRQVSPHANRFVSPKASNRFSCSRSPTIVSSLTPKSGTTQRKPNLWRPTSRSPNNHLFQSSSATIKRNPKYVTTQPRYNKVFVPSQASAPRQSPKSSVNRTRSSQKTGPRMCATVLRVLNLIDYSLVNEIGRCQQPTNQMIQTSRMLYDFLRFVS
jgi:hypothetical protein